MEKKSECSDAWKKFLKRHWKMSIFMLLAMAVVLGAGLIVFLWFVGDAQATGLVPSMVGDWSVAHMITFILNIIFWELVLVATWAVPLALIVYFAWYKKLPPKELKEYEKEEKAKSKDDNPMSFFAGLVWLAIVWFYGFWDLPFKEWTLNNWVYSWVGAWLIIIAIMAVFGGGYLVYVLSRDE